MKDDLVKGVAEIDAEMNSEELEALEEEDKFVNAMVKKGTMQKVH